MNDDVLTRNENEELAVRTVVSSGDNYVNPNDVYTRDDEGKLCVRVTGAGGNSHDKGWFATPDALREALPTAEDGDYAIVGSTDSVWVWDSDTTDWKDSGVQPTNDYEDLSNKPQINGITLSGDKSKADLGITDNKAIEIANNTTVSGFSVPNPTAEELTDVYNAVVAGRSVQMVDSNDVYYQVLQADSVNDAINIEILYFSEMSLLYTLENDTVSIESKKIGGSAKNVVTLTGESGTLTAEQIALVVDDTAVLEIVCDGEVFRLSNKDSTLTYRTYTNTNCEASETVSFKVIYIQLNQEAVNYGVWTLEEVSAGAEIDDSSTALNKVWSASKLNTMIGDIETLLSQI